MVSHHLTKTLAYLKQHVKEYEPPMGARIVVEYGGDPFILLVSCLLSLRARDVVTYGVSKKLFEHAQTPQELLKIPVDTLAAIIKPIGFYRVKAKVLHAVSRSIVEKFHGVVPQSEEELLQLPGVGPKTANFMLCYAFHRPAICVDTHVHRLANLFGWVTTRTPAQTEEALKRLVPQDLWCELNTILVTWGQQVCTPRLSQGKKKWHDAICPCGHGGHPPVALK